MKYINKLLINKKAIVIIYVVLAILASVQSYLQPHKTMFGSERTYTCYNNYVIFKNSFHHLTEGKDLYQLYPEEHWDLYKYSPTFSVFFGTFSYFPDLIGLSLWNILNATILLLSIYYLPKLDQKTKGLILIVILIELITSMQSEQSNALMAGLIILTFGLLEKEKYFWATFCIICTIYIKIFGLVALSLFIFYPHKWKLGLYTLFWSLIFLILPLVIVDYSYLKFIYLSWKNLLSNDFSIYYGLSVAGWLISWFNFNVDKNLIVLLGAILFCIPLIRLKEYANYSFRLSMLASVLIWIVIFNHKAESPTFIIAMSGVAIWYFSQSYKIENLILLILAFVFTSLSPTDLFPRIIRDEFFKPYVLKVVPCILIWAKIIYDISFHKIQPREVENIPLT